MVFCCFTCYQRYNDERLASQLDPWSAAEAEWAEVEKENQIAENQKTIQKMLKEEQYQQTMKKVREEKDRQLAEKLQKEGTPLKERKNRK